MDGPIVGLESPTASTDCSNRSLLTPPNPYTTNPTQNSIIIFTSNIGSSTILSLGGDPAKDAEMKEMVMAAMKENFRPEFLNRVDEVSACLVCCLVWWRG